MLLFVATAAAATPEQQISALKKELNDATFRVQHIVNQPVKHLKRSSAMHVIELGPVWFHPGATKPVFATVDIRKTQQFDYDAFPYVTSDLNLGEVFIGSELEFNPMTKYFYTDRSVPKKKLGQAEMSEINGLYRIIGRCETALYPLEHPDPPAVVAQKFLEAHRTSVVGGIVALLTGLVLVRRRSQLRAE